MKLDADLVDYFRAKLEGILQMNNQNSCTTFVCTTNAVYILWRKSICLCFAIYHFRYRRCIVTKDFFMKIGTKFEYQNTKKLYSLTFEIIPKFSTKTLQIKEILFTCIVRDGDIQNRQHFKSGIPSLLSCRTCRPGWYK